MTPLVLSLALTAPAQPPAYPALPPGVRVQPQVATTPVYRPVVVVPVAYPTYPTYPNYPVVPSVPQAPQAVTLGDFSRLFAPTPGKHDVWVVHPVTGQPVKVCFVLPAGKLRDFEVGRRFVRFEFARGQVVEIDFRANGTVRVDYDR
jgi:hypothetical protein